MDYWTARAEFLEEWRDSIQYLSLKCLIKMALWSWWFQARNRSLASPEGVLTKVLNIQLTKIKNLFGNYCFCLTQRSFWVEGKRRWLLLPCANEAIDVLPWYWALKPLCRWLLSVTKCSRSQFLLLMMGAGIFIPVSLRGKCQERPVSVCGKPGFNYVALMVSRISQRGNWWATFAKKEK